MFKYSVPFIVMTAISSAQIVSSIDIRGHQNTREYIIEREIQHPLRVALDSSIAQTDRDRIENLGIFSTVTWQAVPLEDGTVKLRYHVIESTRFFPIFSPSYEEETGWSFVFGGFIKILEGAMNH
jgi:outer membrane protein assembly factor BamA